MRVLCPACQKSILIPDADAGKSVRCTECGHSFPAPEVYSLSPRPESPPLLEPTRIPGEVPAPVAGEAKPASAPTPVSVPPSGARECSVSLSPVVLQWIPAIGLTLCFLLTFFSNNGLYPGGYSAYTQNAWLSLFASVSEDSVAEKKFSLAKDVFAEQVKSSWWMLLYLPTVILGLALAWMIQLVAMGRLPMPAVLEPYRAYQNPLLVGLCMVAFLALTAQWTVGFGLRNAYVKSVETKYEKIQELVKTPEETQLFEMEFRKDMDGMRPATSTAFRISWTIHWLVILALAGRLWLEARPSRPMPKLTLTY